jgi:hypothetical protein
LTKLSFITVQRIPTLGKGVVNPKCYKSVILYRWAASPEVITKMHPKNGMVVKAPTIKDGVTGQF